jgi:hypothetical protein
MSESELLANLGPHRICAGACVTGGFYRIPTKAQLPIIQTASIRVRSLLSPRTSLTPVPSVRPAQVAPCRPLTTTRHPPTAGKKNGNLNPRRLRRAARCARRRRPRRRRRLPTPRAARSSRRPQRYTPPPERDGACGDAWGLREERAGGCVFDDVSVGGGGRGGWRGC